MIDGDEAWHRPLRLTARGETSAATAQSPGMHRLEGISGRLSGAEKIWMGESRVEPGVRTADHHHGESETGIYVVSGHPRFVFLVDGEQTAIDAGPGDYVFVPPWTPHREENPSPDDPATVVLARSTQEAIVVNVADLTGRPLED